MFYVYDENNNKYEALDKEGVLAVLQQAITDGTLNNIVADAAFVSKLKCCVSNTTWNIAFVTQQVYNELKSQELTNSDTYYIITDATNEELSKQLTEALTSITTLEQDNNVLMSEHLKGVQLWDEQWELGSYDGNGNDIASNLSIRTKNFIPITPNATYTINYIYFDVYTYDSAYNFVAYYDSAEGLTFTVGSNECYLKFRLAQAYGTIYNNDIILYEGVNKYTHQPYNANKHITNYEAELLKKEYLREENLLNYVSLVNGTTDSEGKPIDIGQITRVVSKNFVSVKPNTTYTLNTNSSFQVYEVNYFDTDKNNIALNIINQTNITFTTPSNCYYLIILFRYSDDSSIYVNEVTNNAMLTNDATYKGAIIREQELPAKRVKYIECELSDVVENDPSVITDFDIANINPTNANEYVIKLKLYSETTDEENFVYLPLRKYTVDASDGETVEYTFYYSKYGYDILIECNQEDTTDRKNIYLEYGLYADYAKKVVTTYSAAAYSGFYGIINGVGDQSYTAPLDNRLMRQDNKVHFIYGNGSDGSSIVSGHYIKTGEIATITIPSEYRPTKPQRIIVNYVDGGTSPLDFDFVTCESAIVTLGTDGIITLQGNETGCRTISINTSWRLD